MEERCWNNSNYVLAHDNDDTHTTELMMMGSSPSPNPNSSQHIVRSASSPPSPTIATTLGARLLHAFGITLPRQYLLQLSIGVWISISNGAIFCFGIFSPYLKQAPFHFSQAEVNTIATAGAMASFISPPVGFLYDRFGTSVTLAAGAALNLIGWTGLYFILIFASTASDDSSTLGNNTSTILLITIFFSFSQMSSPFYEQGSVLANLQGLSTHRGKVVMIQKTFMGLGSGIISQVYSSFFFPARASSTTSPPLASGVQHPALETLGNFCLLLAVYSVVAGVLGALITNVPAAGNGRIPAASSSSLKVPGINNGPDPLLLLKESTQLPSPPATTTIVSIEDRGEEAITTPAEEDGKKNNNSSSYLGAGDFKQLATEENILANQFSKYFHSATVLTLVLVALVASITVVDAYWSGNLNSKADNDIEKSQGVDSFNNWQVWTSVLTLFLSVAFVPLVYLGPKFPIQTLPQSLRPTPPAHHHHVTACIISDSRSSKNGVHYHGSGGYREEEEQNGNTSISSPATAKRGGDGGGGGINGGGTTAVTPATTIVNDIYNDNTTPDTAASLIRNNIVSMSSRFLINSNSLRTNLLTSPNWWLLWLQCFSVWGTATLISTNSSQIYYALDTDGYSETGNAAMVSIFGVASALGRITVGWLDGYIQRWKTGDSAPTVDKTNNASTTSVTRVNSGNNKRKPLLHSSKKRLLTTEGAAVLSHTDDDDDYDEGNSGIGGDKQCQKNGIATTTMPDQQVVVDQSSSQSSWIGRFRSRQPDELVPIYFFLIPSFVLSVGLPLFLVIPPKALLVCFFMVGFAAGFTFGSVILVVSGLLSQMHAGKHYGFVGSAGFATPILFNIVIFAKTYEEVGGSQPGYVANNNQCVGKECLVSSMLTCTGLNVVAFLLMVVLVRRVLRNGTI